MSATTQSRSGNPINPFVLFRGWLSFMRATKYQSHPRKLISNAYRSIPCFQTCVRCETGDGRCTARDMAGEAAPPRRPAGDRSPSTRRTHACPARAGSATHGKTDRERPATHLAPRHDSRVTTMSTAGLPLAMDGSEGPRQEWKNPGNGSTMAPASSGRHAHHCLHCPMDDGRSIPFIATLNKILPSLCYHRPPRDQCDPTQHPSSLFLANHNTQYPYLRSRPYNTTSCSV
jgi:hypothetical protein